MDTNIQADVSQDLIIDIKFSRLLGEKACKQTKQYSFAIKELMVSMENNPNLYPSSQPAGPKESVANIRVPDSSLY